jgi:putative membrane protein
MMGWMWFGGFISFILLVVFILIAVWAIGRYGRYPGGNPEAINIVRERYARGEISKEEFDCLKKDLS